MDKNLQINRNYYLNAVAYINAANLLAGSYKTNKIDESHHLYTIQIWPLYYLLTLSAEMALKAGLVLYDIDPAKLRSRRNGHNLNWLLDKYNEIISNVDWNLDRMIRSLNKSECRYTEFYGAGAYLSPFDHFNFISLLQDLVQKDQTEALNRMQNARN
ncbi:MAG: hypothetical protein ACXW30_05380 [Micavibrio sp.]